MLNYVPFLTISWPSTLSKLWGENLGYHRLASDHRLAGWGENLRYDRVVGHQRVICSRCCPFPMHDSQCPIPDFRRIQEILDFRRLRENWAFGKNCNCRISNNSAIARGLGKTAKSECSRTFERHDISEKIHTPNIHGVLEARSIREKNEFRIVEELWKNMKFRKNDRH